MKKPIRNYLKLVNELINIPSPLDVDILGVLIHGENYYPYLSLHSHSRLAKYNVVIHSGVHGNESIGVKVLLRFISEFNSEFLGYYNFFIMPIVNPYGYQYAVRHNGDKQYVNDGFIDTDNKLETQESYLIKNALPAKIDLFLDIHADVSKNGFYIYERKRPNKKSLAEIGIKILKRNKMPIVDSATIYREKCVNGVIIKPEKDGSADDAMFKKGAVYSLCLEIPGKAQEDTQLVGGLLLLNELLKQFKEIVK